MPSQLQNQDDDPDTTASNLSPEKMKTKTNGIVLNQGSTLAKPMQNAVKKKAVASKPSAASKKSCICAPTAHTGSFRCHLHRLAAPQKSSSKLSENNIGKRSAQSFNSTNKNTLLPTSTDQVREIDFGTV